MRTILRGRCPHCGRGAVLSGFFSVHPKCTECGYVYNRGNPAYFSGAIFINYLSGAGATLASFLLFLVATWPDVPWSALYVGFPVTAVVLVLLLHPVSKLVLMAVDTRMRPVLPDEIARGRLDE